MEKAISELQTLEMEVGEYSSTDVEEMMKRQNIMKLIMIFLGTRKINKAKINNSIATVLESVSDEELIEAGKLPSNLNLLNFNLPTLNIDELYYKNEEISRGLRKNVRDNCTFLFIESLKLSGLEFSSIS